MPSRFELGNLYITPGASAVLEAPFTLLARHAACDWGELSNEDIRANEHALTDGSRILSAYTVDNHRIWIITEAVGDDGHRAATTILLPPEY